VTGCQIELVSRSERDTRRIAECLAAGIRAESRAVVIAIEGELGAGKTRFVRGLAAGFGADVDAIASPTFVLLVEHRGIEMTLVHMDAWRLRGAGELDSLGFDELLHRANCVVAVEWPSKIATALPEARIDVAIEWMADNERRLTITDRRGELQAERVATALALFVPSIAPERQRCPTCNRDVSAASATFPFCSSCCRMADLGRWFGGQFRLSRPAESDEELSE